MLGRSGLERAVELALILMLGAGCDSARPGADSVLSVRDSAGVQIVEYDLDGSVPAQTLARQPRVSFSSDEEAFNIIRSFSRSDDGRYLILDDIGGARVFDRTGALAARVGRYGQGPTEVQIPSEAWWRDDGGIVIYDARGSALLHFSREYEFEKRVPVHNRYSREVLPLADGHVLFTRWHADSATIGYTRDYNTVHIVGPRGDSAVWSQTVAGDGRMTTDPSMLRGSSWACPFMHETLIEAWDSTVVADLKAPRPSLQISGIDGRAYRILRRPGPEIPPASEEQIAWSTAEFRYHVPESSWDDYDPSRCDVPSIAEVSRILASPKGDLWMARERTFSAFEERLWDLVSLSGVHQSTLRLHPHFRVLEFGERDVLGILTTEIGEVLPLVFDIEAG